MLKVGGGWLLGTGCRTAGTKNFGGRNLRVGREGREVWNVCGWRLVVVSGADSENWLLPYQ